MNKVDIKAGEEKVIYTKDDEVTYNLGVNAKLKVFHFNFNKSSNIVINLNGEGAFVEYHYSTINWLDNTLSITVNHNVSKTTSNIYNHGVNCLDKKLVFDVNGIVPKTSAGCVCNQENQIINLRDGKGIIKPNLLIDNYDVISSHAAYIGKFKKDKIFYLMSRGLSEKKATELLIKSLLINGAEEKEKVVRDFLAKLMEV